MRIRFATCFAVFVLGCPGLAWAQEPEPECPPGGWFCEETEPPTGDESTADQPPQQPPDGRPPRVRPWPPLERGPRHRHMDLDRPEDRPKPPRRRQRPKWGLNLHLEGVAMGGGEDRHPDAGMAGLGFSFRYRPIPHFAFDAGLDFVGGTDFQGWQRSETALLLNGLVYFNPRNAVQVYMLGGIGFSGATVQRTETFIDAAGNQDEFVTDERHYSYFGAQLGVGLEFRVTRKISLNVDVLGFMRGRTDDQARYEPEFIDPQTGRTTNTSGGGLVRGGITFWW